MYLSKAKELLNEEYLAKRVLADEHGKRLIEEKIVHSYQVLGAGNMILKNEAVYQNCSDIDIDKLRATLLLHDLGRFEEGVSKGIDHGVWGADLLAKVDEFKEPKIRIAVKHHGHLIEDLYKDGEYLFLSDEEKEEVKKYIFLVRDADKVANFYLLSRKFNEMETLFMNPNIKTSSKDVSNKIRENFLNHQSINKKDVITLAEQALMILACVFDLNYRASFEFLSKMCVIEKFFGDVEKYFSVEDGEIFRTVLFDYVKEHLKN